MEHDVASLSPLTKEDVIDFYTHYIAPSSQLRSKLSVHLLAQSSPAEIAEALSDDEQSARLLEALSKFLATYGIAPNPEKLTARFQGVDVRSGDKIAIANAVSAYLSQDEGIADPKLSEIITSGTAVLGTVLPSLGIEPEPGTEEEAAMQEAKGKMMNGDAEERGRVPVQGNGTVPVRIADVHTWKAERTVAPGARPVRDLVEFEEGGAKL